ncbi:leucine-rich repeat-containing protein 43-like [Clarias gariepinus]|uniref:leucine-rich repeat-containing protein 43-like n=1 Tax=Clarias gariepinus TaxID=13013 RepID=UPI00234C65B1|nr:leucine-rich repeat-containing protein 43-like [Clarias gariepinus]
MTYCTLTSAIDELVHSLCLESFPCDRGSWLKPSLKGYEDWHDDKNTKAQSDDSDNLHVLLKGPLSPWHEGASWSPQSLVLRELAAVKATKKHNAKLIYSFLKTLRIVNKGVSVIDEGLLRLSCVEELILTVNNITEVPFKNLPKTLKVLELYGNQISSLRSLITDLPPHLLHLGLGHNRLGSPDDLQYFTASLWPQLMSLDLSWSGYTEQYGLVDVLSKLPHLRSLVLEGNPLTLTTLYPGFTVDSLVHLLYLDANQVTPEDRLHFRGLAQIGASVSEEAEITVCVNKMKGVPNSNWLLDGAADFPMVSYSYSVSFEFLDEAQTQKSHIYAGSQTSENIPQDQGENKKVTSIPCVTSNQQGNASSTPIAINWTSKQEWAEEIEFNYASTHRIRDLAALKNFILRGLWLTVEEQKVLSWPAPSMESAGIKVSTNMKDKEVKIASTKSKKKKKKKEKDPELKLVHEQPIKRTLGLVHVKLKDLLEGKNQIEEQCDFVVQHSEPTIRTAATQEKDKIKKPKEDNNEDKLLKPTNLKGKEKGCMKTVTEALDEESNPSKMKPLTVDFSIRVDKWTPDLQALNRLC